MTCIHEIVTSDFPTAKPYSHELRSEEDNYWILRKRGYSEYHAYGK